MTSKNASLAAIKQSVRRHQLLKGKHMQTILLGLATAITLLALVTHVTIGTAQNASPILDNKDLPSDPRHTLAFSWKANSILMLFMTVAFASGFWGKLARLCCLTLPYAWRWRLGRHMWRSNQGRTRSNSHRCPCSPPSAASHLRAISHSGYVAFVNPIVS